MRKRIALAVTVLLAVIGMIGNAGAVYQLGYIQTPYREEENNFPEIWVYEGEYWVTGYDICMSCCGKTDGITASGTMATAGRTCAGTMEFGTELYIKGIGRRTVEDRGVGDGCLDVVCGDHEACYEITGWYQVWRIR